MYTVYTVPPDSINNGSIVRRVDGLMYLRRNSSDTYPVDERTWRLLWRSYGGGPTVIDTMQPQTDAQHTDESTSHDEDDNEDDACNSKM